MKLNLFQHTAARRRLVKRGIAAVPQLAVSTHSRPKAAGRSNATRQPFLSVSFNTQPPEGGWDAGDLKMCDAKVSTHSRPKAAGNLKSFYCRSSHSFQHTAARRRLGKRAKNAILTHFCFNTQPPEGGWFCEEGLYQTDCEVSTHSRPKAAGRHAQ